MKDRGYWLRGPADRPRHIVYRQGRLSKRAKASLETHTTEWEVVIDEKTADLIDGHLADIRSKELGQLYSRVRMDPQSSLATWIEWNVEAHLAWMDAPKWIRRAVVLNEDMESLINLFSDVEALLRAKLDRFRSRLDNRGSDKSDSFDLWTALDRAGQLVAMTGAVRFWVMPSNEVLVAQGFSPTELSDQELEWRRHGGEPPNPNPEGRKPLPPIFGS